jgi:hypothetical protein
MPCAVSRAMNNYRLKTADRPTHIKIVAVSLMASAVLVGIGTAARPDLPDMSTRMAVGSAMVTAGKPLAWTSANRVTVR